MRSLTDIVSNIFTGNDNVNFVHARVFCAAILIFYCWSEWFAIVVRFQEFLPKDFAFGIVQIVGLFAGHEYFSGGNDGRPPDRMENPPRE